jgi:carbon monoxide dehydrogenase subunit G
MPEREAKFSVNATPAEVWRFVRDFESLCTCIPGVESIKLLDARTAELVVRERIGVVPLVLTLTAKIDAEEPPQRLHAVATAEHLTMEIDLALRGSGAQTEMLGRLKVKGEGQLKRIVDSLFEKRATERTAQFADCLGKRFGAVSAPAVSPSRRAGRGWMSRLAAWLRRMLGALAPPKD